MFMKGWRRRRWRRRGNCNEVYLRQKNEKSGWWTWSEFSQSSAACMREFANSGWFPEFGVHSETLYLYEARPKAGSEICETPSLSDGGVTTRGCTASFPANWDSLFLDHYKSTTYVHVFKFVAGVKKTRIIIATVYLSWGYEENGRLESKHPNLWELAQLVFCKLGT